MSSVPENIEALKITSAEFLLTDLDVAWTFMDVAETSGIEETVVRNHQNARKAYDTVLDFLSKLTLTASDRNAVEEKLAVLKTRLENAGQLF